MSKVRGIPVRMRRRSGPDIRVSRADVDNLMQGKMCSYTICHGLPNINVVNRLGIAQYSAMHIKDEHDSYNK